MSPEWTTFGFAAACCVAMALWVRSMLAQIGTRMIHELDDLKTRIRMLEDARVKSQENHTTTIVEQERRHATNMDNVLGMTRAFLKKPCGEELRRQQGFDSDVFRREDRDKILKEIHDRVVAETSKA